MPDAADPRGDLAVLREDRIEELRAVGEVVQ